MGIIVIRTVFIYLITVIALRVMGKRQIGEFEPAEFVTTIIVSEIATLPLQDLQTPIIYSVLPICALITMESISSILCLKSNRYRNLMAGEYSVIINEGKLDIEQMRKSQLTIDELCEELRQNGILSLEDVRFCILETSGKVSVITKENKIKAIPVTIIHDGRIMSKNLKKLGMDKEQVRAVVKERGLEVKNVFFMCECDGKYTVIEADK